MIKMGVLDLLLRKQFGRRFDPKPKPKWAHENMADRVDVDFAPP